MSTPWYLLGTGALGGLWACRLARAGIPVELLMGDEQLNAYQRAGGLTLTAPGTTATTEQWSLPARAMNAERSIDRLLVFTKAHQTLTALQPLLPQFARNASIVLMQNGMGVTEAIQARRPDLVILNAVSHEGAYRRTRFELIQTGEGITRLGHRNNAIARPDWFGSLRNAVSGLEWQPAITDYLWRKLIVNCSINPLTALNDCTNGELLSDSTLACELEGVISECHAVTARLGVLPDNRAQLATLVTDVIRGTAANRSSMLQDLRAGRTTEIEFITGYLCKQASKAGIATPVNDRLRRAVQARTGGGRGVERGNESDVH